MSASYVEELKQQALQEPFAADIVTYLMGNPLSETELSLVRVDSEYFGGVRNGGVKFILDGSPQGRTAWMSQPYNEVHQGVDRITPVIRVIFRTITGKMPQACWREAYQF